MIKNITMGGTRFRLDFNLQNLSMTSIAAKLWDSKDIKSEIKNNYAELVRQYPDKNWCEISKMVVQYANSINLPPSLSAQLKKTILIVGQKIYDWIHCVNNILGLDFIFTQKIYFRFGVIDEIKIFDLYWRDLITRFIKDEIEMFDLYWRYLIFPNDFIIKSDYFRHSPLFSLACMFGCERFVKERKNEMMNELLDCYSRIKAGDEICNIMSVSICSILRRSSRKNVASRQQMLKMCLDFGFCKAAGFFWEKLDEVEKESNLTDFAKKCFRNCSASFSMEKYCEFLLFLTNQMGEEEKSAFIADYADEIIKLFLPIWPYQELIVDILKYDWNIESFRLRKMANFLISFSMRMNRLEFPLNNELVFQIMEKAWGNMSVDERHRFFGENESTNSSFFITWNPESVNLLFNDPSIKDVADKIKDSFIKKGFMELVETEKSNFLNAIIKSNFYFIPELKVFLKENFSNHDFIRRLIVNDGSFGLVDQLLDWLTESEPKRARLKNKIYTISVWKSLTGPDYKLVDFQLADKFLKWRFETEAEIKSFKEEMKSYNFVIVESAKYVRIKSGDLSWLKPGDSLAMHPDEDPFDNADGLTFLEFKDASQLNRGVVLGLKRSVNYNLVGLDGCHAKGSGVYYVGTKVGDFILFTVCDIWKNIRYPHFNFDEVVNLSNSLIKFYYETDEEFLRFKKTKLHVLATENLVEFLLYAFESRYYFPNNFVDGFCEFCTVPSDKIEEIKIQHRNDIEKFLDTYLIDQHKFRLVEYYLNWLFGKVTKTEVCKKFLNSSNKGALLCISYLKKWGKFFSQFSYGTEIWNWLSLVDDMEKLKNDVFAEHENTPEWLPAYLNKLGHK